MSLDVSFDGTLVDENYIIGFKLNTPVFTDVFRLGTTICRTAELKVLREGMESVPESVSFTLPDTTTCVTHVDNVDDSDDTYYVLSLIDSMVLLNRIIDLSACTTAGMALTRICSDLNLSHNLSNSSAVYGYAFSWDGFLTARDVVSMIAEANGCYVTMVNDVITFNQHNNTSAATIDLEDCADFTVGTRHNITRIVYDNGVSFYEEGTTDGETLYLNTDNVFFGGNDTLTRIQVFSSRITAMDFYNVSVAECPVVSASAGQTITIGGYNTLVQENFVYYNCYVGGYELDLQSNAQEETSVIRNKNEQVVAGIKSTIDYQAGLLDILATRTDGIEADMIHFQVDGVAQEVRVTSQDDIPPTSYTSFKDDGMRVYVDGEQVAEATASIFECHKGLGVQDWVIAQPNNDPNILCFYRR